MNQPFSVITRDGTIVKECETFDEAASWAARTRRYETYVTVTDRTGLVVGSARRLSGWFRSVCR